MADVVITFTTKAEVAGAVEIQNQLQKTIGKKKALGEEYTKEQSQLANVDRALAAHAATHKATVPAIDASGESLDELNRTIDKLASSIPGMAAAIGLIASPLGAVGAMVGLSIAAFEELDSKIGTASLNLQNFTPEVVGFDAWPRVFAAANTHAAAFAESLKLQAESFERIKAATSRRIEGINNEANAEKQLIAAQRDKDTAGVEEDLRSGRISPAEARARRRAIVQGADQAGTQVDIRAMDAGAVAKRSELADMDLRVRQAGPQLARVKKELNDAQAALDRDVKHGSVHDPAVAAEFAKLKSQRNLLEHSVDRNYMLNDKQSADLAALTGHVLPTRTQREEALEQIKDRQSQLSKHVEESRQARLETRRSGIATLTSERDRLEGVTRMAEPGGDMERLRGEMLADGSRRNTLARTAPQVQAINADAQARRDTAADNADLITNFKSRESAVSSLVTQLKQNISQGDTAAIIEIGNDLIAQRRELAAMRAEMRRTNVRAVEAHQP